MSDVNLGSVYASLELNTKKWDSAIKSVQNSMNSISKSVNQQTMSIADAFDTIGKSAKNLGRNLTLAVSVPLLGVGAGAIKVSGDLEQNKVAFDVMLGSAEKASKLLKQLSDFAVKSPFTLPQIVTASKQLLAYGFSADEVVDTTRRLGDVSAALGLDMTDLAWLYGTTRTQGRLFARDVYQFTMRGIPLVDELAKVFGVTKDKVMDLVSEGKVGFPQVQQALVNMTNDGGKFGGLMERQSKTLKGVTSNILDDLVRVSYKLVGIRTDAGHFGEVIEGGFFDKVKKGAEAVLNALDRFSQWLDKMPPGIKNMIVGFVGLIAAAGPAIWIFGELAENGSALFKMFNKTSKLRQAFSKLFSAGPWGWIIVAVATLAVGFYLLWTRCEKFRKAITAVYNAIAKPIIRWMVSEIEKLKAKLIELNNATGGKLLKGLKILGITFLVALATPIIAVTVAIIAVVAVIAGIIGAISWLTKALIIAGQAISNSFITAWNFMKNLVIIIWTAISNFLTTVIMSIYNFFVTVWTAIKDFLVMIWNAIWSVIQIPVNMIYQFLRLIFWAIAFVIIVPMRWVWTEMQIIWSAVWGLIVTVGTAIANFFTLIWTNIKNFFIAIWNAIWGFLSPILIRIKNLFSTIWNAIWGTISTIGTWIWNKITGIFGGMAGAVGGSLSRLWGTIKSWFGTITGYLSGLASSAFRWGANLIQGFIDGVKSMFTKIGNVFKGAADKIKNFLGFHSPTKEGPGKEADQWMPNLINMMIGQIEAYKPRFLQALSGISGNLGISAQVAGAGAISGSTNTSNVTVNVGTLIGDESSMRELEKRIARATKQNAISNGQSINSYLESQNE